MELFRKYQLKSDWKADGFVYECVAELDNGDFVLAYGHKGKTYKYAAIVSKERSSAWEEYVEPPKPIVHERWITWGKYQNEVFCHTSFEKPKYSSTHEILKQEQIYFTEFPEPVQKETKKRSIVNCERDCERRGDCTCS